MRTLIERLRTPETPDPIYQSLGNLCREAADEIERLRAALKFYAKAIVPTVAPDSPGHCDDGGLARRTLDQQKGGSK